MIRTGLRALLWLAASAGLLLAGFALFGFLVLIPTLVARGGLPTARGWSNLAEFYQVIVLQALLPELGFAFASWLVVAWVWPRPERSGRGLALGLLGVAALWFPFVGEHYFTAWESTGPATYASTCLLVAGGAAAALWLARILLPALAPGCFAGQASRDIVVPGD